MSGAIRRDLFFAYLAAGARVLSWVVVIALVKRRLGGYELGILALVRSTVGFFNYAGLGLAPALVHRMARALNEPKDVLPIRVDEHQPGDVLSYAATLPRNVPGYFTHVPYSNGWAIAVVSAGIALIALYFYASQFTRLHEIQSRVSAYAFDLVFYMGLGVIVRWISDVPGAVLQATGRIWLDNLILALGEGLWVWMCLEGVWGADSLANVAKAFTASGLVTLTARSLACGRAQKLDFPMWRWVRSAEVKVLLGFGMAVVLSQLAEFLYAPTDVILIHHLLGPSYAADYIPAMHIDGGLLLLVAGISGVLLPRAALASAEGHGALLRHYYIRGTLVSFAILLAAGLAVWALSPLIFKAWLGDDMPETREILPWMLIHTVVGGASGVGRSILIGMGRVRAFTISVLVAGVANVVLSYVFVRYFGMGLKGIVLGTIVVVVSRCVVWQPAYVLRAISTASARPSQPVSFAVPPPTS